MRPPSSRSSRRHSSSASRNNNSESSTSSSMPKKRFTSQYSKPPSTVHPSLASSTGSSSSNHNATPTVNDLISSSRTSGPSSQPPTATIPTMTLPPQIRHLLAQPETPTPRPRIREFDAYGRRIRPFPTVPRSWIEEHFNKHDLLGKRRSQERKWPTNIAHLPGLPEANGMSLQDTCLRQMSRHWEFIREYEKYHLAELPSGHRMKLLSYIAVYGPDEGVGFEGLKTILMPPPLEDGKAPDFDAGEKNEKLFRIDLSGAMGHSVSFRQLLELVQVPAAPADLDPGELSWDDNALSHSIYPIIPNLTHLSLSHPASTVSWPRLLALAKQIPNLTHLSLAFWPVPSLTPNAKTAVVAAHGQEIQYGGTNAYSHSLDNDFSEAADVLRRLADRLHGLEYLDVTGCTHWLRALRWSGQRLDRCVEWGNQWSRLRTIKAHSGIELSEESEFSDVALFVMAHREATITEEMLRWWMRRNKILGRPVSWIDVQKDDWEVYKNLWHGSGKDNEKKRTALESLGNKDFMGESQWTRPFVLDSTAVQEGVIERMSVWDQ